MVLIGLDSDARVSLYGVPLWAALLGAGYRVLKRRDPAAFARRPHLPPPDPAVDPGAGSAEDPAAGSPADFRAPRRCSGRAGPCYFSRMLTITQDLYDAIVAHARADHPDEACGIVAGPEGSGRPERFVPMLNAARSPTFYEFDSTDLLRLYRDMDDRDEEPVIVYHSHTATEAYPSRTDISYANEPGAHYVLVSTAEEFQFRSFRIVDGQVTEEPVEVVPSTS